MRNNKILSVTMICFWFISLFFMVIDSFAYERDDIIAWNLDCLTEHYPESGHVDWNNICSFEEEVKEKGAMDDILKTVNSYELAPIVVTSEPIKNSYDYEYIPEPKINRPQELKQVPSRNKDWSFYNILSRDNPLTELEMGYDFSRITYEEPSVMKNHGNMSGFYAGYTFRISKNEHIQSLKDIFSDTNKVNMFKVEFGMTQGKVDYKSQGTGSIEDIEDRIIEVRGLMGYDIPLDSRMTITPYTGFGYRYLNDDSSNMVSTTGALGYERENKCYYLPLGILTEAKFNDSWKIGLNLEYDVFLGGQQISHLEDVGMFYGADGDLHEPDPIKNEQYKGYGLKAKFRVVKLNKSFDLFFEPYVNYWEKKDSDLTQLTSEGYTYGWYYDEALTLPVQFYEPFNQSTEVGAKVGFIF